MPTTPNPPAFSNQGNIPEGYTVIPPPIIMPSSGMTLRDYFAAKALQGILSDPNGSGDLKKVPQSAYRYADAMLEARLQGEEGK